MAMKDQWAGTLMFVVQPAEERVGGAAANCSMATSIRLRLSGFLVVFMLCSVFGLAHRLYQVAAPAHAERCVFSSAAAACGPALYALPPLNEYQPPQMSAEGDFES